MHFCIQAGVVQRPDRPRACPSLLLAGPLVALLIAGPLVALLVAGPLVALLVAGPLVHAADEQFLLLPVLAEFLFAAQRSLQPGQPASIIPQRMNRLEGLASWLLLRLVDLRGDGV